MLVLFPLFVSAQQYSIDAPGQVSPLTKEDVNLRGEEAVTKDTVLPPPKFTYTLQTKRYATTIVIDTIRPAKLGSEPVQKLYRTYARAGVGNYSTIYGEFSAVSLRSKSSAWGIHFRHLSAGKGPSSVPGEFAGYNQQDVNLFGKKFLKKHTLYGALNYDRDAVYNYGGLAETALYEKGAIRQHFNYFDGGARLKSHFTDSTAINHEIGLRFYRLADRYDARENNLLVEINGSRYIRTEKLDVGFGVDYNHNAGATDTVTNTIIRLQPVFSAQAKKFAASIGIGFYLEEGKNSLVHFYPQASLSFNVADHMLVPYITMGGFLGRNSYRSLTQQNPFLASSENLLLRNTSHQYILSAGLRGSLTNEIAYDVRISHYNLLDAHFFVNTTSAQDIFQNKFAIVYDKAQVTTLHGQVGWQHFEKMRVFATLDWYKYQMEKEAHPWHTPTLRMALTGEYNLQDKILARAQIYYLNGQYAKVLEGSNLVATTLKGVVDLNLGLEYRYTKFLSAFLNLNNVAAQRYQRWYGYPTQRFNLLAGLTYTF